MKNNQPKIKRVGLYSMGLVLIASGVLMILSRIFKFHVWNLAVKLWPLILIVLGGEVLYFNYINNEYENIRLQFSFFSMFIILVIVAVNLGLYSLTEMGLADRIKEEINMTNHDISSHGAYEIGDKIDKIVIKGYKNNDMNIRIKDVDTISYTENLSVRAVNRQEAERELEDSIVKFEESGNILYVEKNDISKNGYYYFLDTLDLQIPSHIDVEIIEGDFVKMMLDDLESNILVDKVYDLDLRLNNNLNLEILAEYEHGDTSLDENIWSIEKTEVEDPNDWIKARIKIGEGENKMKLMNIDSIEVNNI